MIEWAISVLPPITSPFDLETLRDAAGILPECADALRARGLQLKPGKRGVRADAVKKRFLEAWTTFARERTGKPLHAIGARLYEIVVGRPISDDQFRREASRTNSRLKQRAVRRNRRRRSTN